MVDPEEGIDLKYILAPNGVRCAKLIKEDATAEIEYWQHAVLCSVLGANPLFEVMQGFFKRIWAAVDIDKINHVRGGVFVVCFGNLQDRKMVKRRGICYFDSQPFFVKGWNPEMDMHTEEIKSLPLWVQFPDLDVRYWGTESLSKMGSLLGIPLKTDRYTKEISVLRYVRLLIDIPLVSPFPDYIEFFNNNEMLLR